jgi:hypothetical protein
LLRFQISTADFTKPSGCHNSLEPWRGPLRRFQVNSGTTGRCAYATAVARCSNGGVIILFRRLSWDYKTNQPFQFGKRIILNCLLSVYGNDTAHAFLNHTTTDQLDDLLRVFHVLDGKPEPDHRHGMYATLNTALHAC